MVGNQKVKMKSKQRFPLLFLTVAAVVVFSGCNSYVPPGGRADFAAFSSSSMQESFAAKPAAQFPASIAAVRVQASRYRSYYTEREGGVYGQGHYSVITVQDVEEPADMDRISKLPDVGGIIAISTLLLPENLQSDKELREAAARLKADMLLLYTFNTSFHENDTSVALSVITLGLSPTRKVFVRVTASALLIDTRTGFIYAAIDANEKRELTTNVWESKESADRARQGAEKAAFKSLINQFLETWPAIVERAHKGA